MPIALETVRALEERAFNAWPALETISIQGWLLRFAGGYTKRANSVNALAPAVPVAGVLPIAETLYAARGLPLVFRLSPLAGPDADAALTALGFQYLDETIVMTASIAGDAARDPDVSIAAQPEAAWSAGFSAANRVPAVRQATRCSHGASGSARPSDPAFRARTTKTAWKASSASWAIGRARQQTPQTSAPCRRNSDEKADSSPSMNRRSKTPSLSPSAGGESRRR